MSKVCSLSTLLMLIAMLLASCESYNGQPGKVNGWVPGQATLTPHEKNPGQRVGVVSNPDVISTVNPNPQQSNLPQATITPQSLLSQPAQSVNNSNVSDWPVYQDTVYHFQISYPSQFEFKMLDTSELEKLKPVAITVTYFYDASTNLDGIVPPRFSIRIYKIDAGTSVENWLKTNGLYQPDSDWTIQKYQGEHFSGYQVSSPLYMAPGLFYIAANGEYLYQLTPLGSDAEKMLTTFEFTN